MENVKYSPDALVFIDEENIGWHVSIYIKLIKQSFVGIKTIRIEKLTDPETNDEKLIITPEIVDTNTIESSYSKYVELLDLRIEDDSIPVEISSLISLVCNT